MWRTPTLIRVGAEGNESGAEDFLLLLLLLVFLLLMLHKGACLGSRDQPRPAAKEKKGELEVSPRLRERRGREWQTRT